MSFGASDSFASPNFGVKPVQLVSFVVSEMDSFQDQFRRSYATNANGEVVNRMQLRFDQALASKRGVQPDDIGNSLFAGVGSEFLTTDATPSGNIAIVNGWNQRRFRFTLEVNVLNQTGMDVYILQGYSDHNDRSLSGLFDPANMDFHINSITKLRTVRNSAGFGMPQQVNRFVTDATHVLIDPGYGQMESLLSPTANPLNAITPTDVFRTMGLMAAGLDGNVLGNEIMDTSTIVTGQPRPSRRGNSLSSEFSGKILQGYVGSKQQSMFGDDGPSMYTDAIGLTSEEAFTTHDFFRALMNATNRPVANTFTYNDLLAMDPTLRDRAYFNENSNNVMNTELLPGSSFAFQSGYSEGWQGADHETQAAVHITNSLPAIMIRLGLTVLHFTATNRNLGGTQIMIGSMLGFDETMLEQAFGPVKTHIEAEILNRISLNNSIGYDLEVRCEIMGQTNIMFSYDGRPPVGYVAPTFADALTAPVMTQDSQRLNNVSWDFKELCEKLVQTDTGTDLANQGAFGSVFNAAPVSGGFSRI